MSSRRSNPLIAVPRFAIGVGGEAIAYSIGAMEHLLAFIGVGATYSYLRGDEGVVGGISNIFLKFLHQIFEFLTNFPNGIFKFVKGILSNIQIFFNVFIILVVLGQFDWLLEDMYSLMVATLVITWATIR